MSLEYAKNPYSRFDRNNLPIAMEGIEEVYRYPFRRILRAYYLNHLLSVPEIVNTFNTDLGYTGFNYATVFKFINTAIEEGAFPKRTEYAVRNRGKSKEELSPIMSKKKKTIEEIYRERETDKEKRAEVTFEQIVINYSVNLKLSTYEIADILNQDLEGAGFRAKFFQYEINKLIQELAKQYGFKTRTRAEAVKNALDTMSTEKKSEMDKNRRLSRITDTMRHAQHIVQQSQSKGLLEKLDPLTAFILTTRYSTATDEPPRTLKETDRLLKEHRNEFDLQKGLNIGNISYLEKKGIAKLKGLLGIK